MKNGKKFAADLEAASFTIGGQAVTNVVRTSDTVATLTIDATTDTNAITLTIAEAAFDATTVTTAADVEAEASTVTA